MAILGLFSSKTKKGAKANSADVSKKLKAAKKTTKKGQKCDFC